MKKEVKIALLVLGAIAIAFFGINFLKGKNIFLPQQNYYAIYPRVDGLSVTNPIWINGFKVGQVSSIDFVPGNQDQLLVALRITNPKVKLTEQTVAKIVSADILGSKGIDLQVKPGNYILPGDTLISDMEDGIMDIVSEQIAPIKAKAENLITSLDSVLIILRTALNESSLNQLGQSFYGIRGTFESVLVSAKN
ncbi:MAG: MlaD family protein, partial [Luteibaculum sp.]